MAKTAIPVDKKVLIFALNAAECDGPLANRGKLWEAAAEIYNKQVGIAKPITFSVVSLRVKEWDLPVKTPVGKKGRAAGVPISEEQKLAMQAGRAKGGRAEKFKPFAAHFEALKSDKPQRFFHVIDKMAAGSMRACVAGMCLECTADQPIEIKHCPSNGVQAPICPLYLFRPYQAKVGETNPLDSETVEEIEIADDDAAEAA